MLSLVGSSVKYLFLLISSKHPFTVLIIRYKGCTVLSFIYFESLIVTYPFSSHPFTIASVHLAPFCLCFFFFCCFLHFSFFYCFHYLYANYQHLLLSQLHFAITSSLYNTPYKRFYNYVINICPIRNYYDLYKYH